MASGGDFAAEVTWRQLGPVLTEYFPHGHEGTRGLKIVEVGCGMGELSFLMQEAGHTVVAIDPSAEAIAATRKKGVTDARQCGLEDLAKTEEERGTFDVVLFTRSLHHIGEDLEGVLRMVPDQLLRSGGILVIEEFGREDIDRPTAEWYYALHDSLVAAGAIDATTRHHHHQSPEKGEGGADRNNNEEEDEAERRARRRSKEEEREVLDRWARQFRWSHHGMVGIADLHLGREMVAAVERVFGHIRVERKPVLFRFIANHVDRKLGKEEEDKKSNKAYEIARNVWRWEERMIYESKAIRPLGILGVARKPAH